MFHILRRCAALCFCTVRNALVGLKFYFCVFAILRFVKLDLMSSKLISVNILTFL